MQSVIIFGVPYAPDYYYLSGGIITIIFSALPWDLLAKGFTDLGSATVSDTAPGAWHRVCRCVNSVEEKAAGKGLHGRVLSHSQRCSARCVALVCV